MVVHILKKFGASFKGFPLYDNVWKTLKSMKARGHWWKVISDKTKKMRFWSLIRRRHWIKKRNLFLRCCVDLWSYVEIIWPCPAGPHYQKMEYADRQRSLKTQYYFTCDCVACEQDKDKSSNMKVGSMVHVCVWSMQSQLWCAWLNNLLCDHVPFYPRSKQIWWFKYMFYVFYSLW